MAHAATHSAMSADMQKCIQECLNCHSVCLDSVRHCIEMGGKHASPEHITLLLDCAQSCQTSADFMLRHSSLHARACAFCAEVCRACEKDCRSLGAGDEMMQKCAEACRRCAESCDRMARMAA